MTYNKVNFKMDAGPERDPVEPTEYLYDAGGPVNDVFKIILTICSFFMCMSCTP